MPDTQTYVTTADSGSVELPKFSMGGSGTCDDVNEYYGVTNEGEGYGTTQSSTNRDGIVTVVWANSPDPWADGDYWIKVTGVLRENGQQVDGLFILRVSAGSDCSAVIISSSIAIDPIQYIITEP